MASVNKRYTAAQAIELTARFVQRNRASDVEDESSADEDYSDVEHVDDASGDRNEERMEAIGNDSDSETDTVIVGNDSDVEREEEQQEPREPDADELENYFYSSKNGDEMWLKESPVVTGRQSSQNVMKQAPGLTAFAARRTETIQDALDLFITPGICKTIIDMSNIEGKRVFGDAWQNITSVELNGYIGLLYLAGVYRSAGESTEELWHATDGRPVFRATMSWKRFKHISRILRFDDKETRTARRAKDKLAPIREVFDAWVTTLSKSFIPYDNVTIDEQLVAFRGRCSFRMYMKSKPAKYGLKLWALCDSATAYVLNLQVYTGKVGNRPEKNQGERVVHDMVAVIEGSGRNVTTDNFFTSASLARQLLKKKLSLVGTVRKNKAEIPAEFLPSRARPVHSSLFGHQQQLTLVSYVPNRNRAVILLSSMHKGEEISDRADRKPEIIMFYNRTKGGVDTMDQMVSTYTTKRMTRR
jgi:hypothetical protein